MNRLRSFVSLLSWVFSCQHPVATGFRAHPHGPLLRRASRNAVTSASLPKSFPGERRLGLSADDADNEDDDNDRITGDDATTESPAEKIIAVVDKASEYLVVAAGVGLAGTLGLNLAGYGFAAQPGGPPRFDTIEQLRTERQMARSVDRPNMYKVKPQNPATDYFRRYPLFVTFSIVGASIWLEEIRAGKDKNG